MHYLLYFPKATGIQGEALAQCGLADLARDKSPEWFPIEGRGPDGGRGMCCTWLRGNGGDPLLALTPQLDWQPCRPAAVPAAGSTAPGGTIAKGAYWIGVDRQRPPTPQDLERTSVFAGYWVTLGDRQKWHAPAAAFLPHCHGLNAQGQYERMIDDAHRAFWERSQQFGQGIMAKLAELSVLQSLKGARAPQKLNADFDLAETFAFAVEALAFNYRINAELATQLKLFHTDEALANVVKAAVDLPVLLDPPTQKKTAQVSIPVG